MTGVHWPTRWRAFRRWDVLPRGCPQVLPRSATLNGVITVLAGRRWPLQVAKMTPIDLHLLARQRAQPQISLGRRARALGADQVAEVAALPRAATLAHPVEEPAGR